MAKLSAIHKNGFRVKSLLTVRKSHGIYKSCITFHERINGLKPLKCDDNSGNLQLIYETLFKATVAIINAMGYWNDYLLPSLVLTKKELYTIPIATQAFYGTYSTDIGLVMAALLLAMLPILILYIFLQRYIVEGVTSGAVKG